MRRIVTVRTLALSTALILALGGIGGASAEDISDTGEPPSVEASEAEESPSDEASPPAEASEEAADETSPRAEKPDTETSEAEGE